MGRRAREKAARRQKAAVNPRVVSPALSSKAVVSPVPKAERWYGYTEVGCEDFVDSRPTLDDMGYPEPEHEAEIGYISAGQREELGKDFALLEEDVPLGRYFLEDKREGRFYGAFALVEEAKKIAEEQLGIVRWFSRQELGEK